MSYRYRRGNFSRTPSLQSIASSADVSIREELLPQPSTLADCDDQLETYQILVQGKSNKKTELIEDLKQLRTEKEPLLKVKGALQEEITSSNLVINAKSEEVTQLKHKLRHHSEKQIQDNIERLEFNLRNNNYKPREEQKILDEIFVLKRSVKTLKEFDLKQRENKKYRAERSRLIDQRNEVFSKLQAVILQEEEIKKEITELRHIISATKKTVVHLKTLRPELEKSHLEEQRLKEELRLKRQKEKARAKKEQYIIKQQERQKRWEEYEASRDPFDDEKDLCKMLLAYLNSALPTSAAKTDDTDSKSESQPDLSPVEPPSSSGSFYCKPKFSPPEKPKGKKKRAKAKKEQKACKVRELSHPPDVLTNLGILNVAIPRTTEDIPHSISLVQKKLDDFNLLSKVKLGNVDEDKKEETVNKLYLKCNISLNSSKENSQSPKENSSALTVNAPVNNVLPLSVIASCSIISNSSPSPVQTASSSSDSSSSNNVAEACNSKSPLVRDHSSSKSYFSIPVPVVSSSLHKKESSLGPTYASVAARIKV